MKLGFKELMLTLFLILITTIPSTAYTATGTITGRIISTSMTINNYILGDLPANNSLYYYETDSGIGYVFENEAANNIKAFAQIDFATNSGYVEVSIGVNKTLPNTAKIIVDDDNVPENTSIDPNQVQIIGNGTNSASIVYSGINGDGKIIYATDGNVYVFLNTGESTSGEVAVDITLTAA
ncbi:hypothetical protein DRO97_09635 [Archaeoglobales archaeon]|nr:MAG: hypothetical protein DRO97_09635 [Archaeoglobales archaeon]